MGTMMSWFHKNAKKFSGLGNSTGEINSTDRQEYFCTIINSSPIPQFVIDAQHRVVCWNRALEEYSGIKASKMEGTNQHWRAFYTYERPCLADLLVDGKIDALPRWYAGKFSKSRFLPEAYEATDFFSQIGPEGTWLYFTAALIRDGQGTVIGAVETLEDVTAQKRSEYALRRAYDRTQKYLDITGVMMVTLDRDGMITLVNKRGCELLGYGEEELIGSNWFDVCIPEQGRKATHEIFAQLMRGKISGVEYFENMILTKSGEERLVAFHNTVLRDTDRKVIGTLSSGLDITQRQKADEQLRESEEKFRAIFDAAIDGMVLADSETQQFYFGNRMFCEMIGCTEAELKDLTVVDIHPSGDLLYVESQFAKLIAQEITVAKEVPVKKKDGEVFFADIAASMVMFSGRKCLLGIFRDVTERRHAEAALHESEARFRTLFEQSPVAIAISRDGRMIYVNPYCVRMFGCEAPEDIVGKPIMALVAPQSREAITEQVQRHGQGSVTSREFEIVGLRKDGASFPLAVAMAYVNLFDGPAVIGFLFDITQRKSAEEDLLHEKAFSDAIIDAIPGSFWVIDANASFIRWNTRLEELFGTSAHDFRGRKFNALSLIHPEDREGARAKLAEIFTSGSSEMEVRVLAKDGVRHLFLTGRKMQMGNAVFAVGIGVDITDRKRAEWALCQSENKYRILMQQAVEGIFIINKEGQFTLANEKCCDLLGYSPEEILGINIVETYLPQERDIARQRLQKLEAGEELHFERRMVRKDGTIFEIQANAKRLENGGLQSMIHDITERKQTENALVASEQKLRAIFDNAEEVIYTLSWTGEFLFVSAAWSHIIGHPLEEVVGKNFAPFVHPDDVKACQDFLRKVYETGLPQHGVEYRVKKTDGEWVWFTSTGAMIRDEQGAPLHYVGVALDITARKQAEEELRESEEKFFKAFHASPAVMAISTLEDGRYIEVNQKFEVLTGYARTDVIGRTSRELSLFDDYADRERMRAQIEEKGSVRDAEIRFRSLTGEVHICLLSAEIFLYQGKNVLLTIVSDITERKKSEAELARLAHEWQMTFDSAGDAIWLLDKEQRVVRTNKIAEQLFHRPSADMIGKHCWEIMHGSEKSLPECPAFRAKASLHRESMELHRGDEWFTVIVDPILDASGQFAGAVHIVSDITEKKSMEKFQQLGVEILGIFNEARSLDDSIERVLHTIKQTAGYDAVGIRLKHGDDFPYFVQTGFSHDFILAENSVIALNQAGGPCRDADGNISLECTCGLVLSGKTDLVNPLFTAGGSAWTNDSFPLLQLPAEQDPRLHPRNRCIHQGYLSVALIPIRVHEKIVGLLQLNDKRKDRFTLDGIRFFEGVASSIGIALSRKQAEEEAQKLATVVRYSSELVNLATVDGMMLFLNEAGQRMLGIEQQELTRMNILQVIPARLREKVQNDIMVSLRQNRVWEGELQYCNLKTGKVTDVYAMTFTICDPQTGTPLYFANISRDITERKLAEAELHAKTEELNAYFTVSLDLMCIADMDGYFRRLNPQWERTLGYSLAELEQRRFLDFVHPDDLLATQAVLEELAAGNEVINFINRYECKDGSYRWIEWRSYPEDGLIYAVARDITDRKESTDALQKSEGVLRSIFNVSPAGVAFVIDRVFFKVNVELCRMTGYSQVELVGRSTKQIYYDEAEFLRVGAELAKQLPEKGTATLETRFKRKDGGLVHVLLGASLLDPHDMKGGITTVMIDITDRKQAEQAVLLSEERLRSLINNMQDVLYRCDAQGTITFVSPSAMRLLGSASLDDIVGKNIASDFYYHPEDRVGFLVELKKAGSVKNYEVMLKTIDGKPLSVTTTSQIFYNDDGTVRGVEGIISDNTQRKRAEDALRAAEERQRFILESSPTGMLITRIADGKVLYANRASCMFFDRTPEDMLTCYATSHLYRDPQEREKVKERIAQDGQLHDHEICFRRRDGASVWASLSVQVIDYDKEKVFLSSIIDMTERRKAQEELNKAYEDIKKAQQDLIEAEKLAALGRFSAGIAHEVKNPLGIILGGIEFLENRISQPDPDVKEAMEKIKTALYRGDNIVHSLLAYARPAINKIEQARLSDLIIEGISLFKYKISSRARVSFQTSFDEGLFVDVDVTKMQQVLFNLFSNAVDAMVSGGAIYVRTCQEQPASSGELPQCVIEVRDTGEGIPQENLSRIFEPFFSTKLDHKGTGLGLPTVKAIIDSHKGTVEVESAEGKGTTVRIRLQRATDTTGAAA